MKPLPSATMTLSLLLLVPLVACEKESSEQQGNELQQPSTQQEEGGQQQDPEGSQSAPDRTPVSAPDSSGGGV